MPTVRINYQTQILQADAKYTDGKMDNDQDVGQFVPRTVESSSSRVNCIRKSGIHARKASV